MMMDDQTAGRAGPFGRHFTHIHTHTLTCSYNSRLTLHPQSPPHTHLPTIYTQATLCHLLTHTQILCVFAVPYTLHTAYPPPTELTLSPSATGTQEPSTVVSWARIPHQALWPLKQPCEPFSLAPSNPRAFIGIIPPTLLFS